MCSIQSGIIIIVVCSLLSIRGKHRFNTSVRMTAIADVDVVDDESCHNLSNCVYEMAISASSVDLIHAAIT